MSAGTYALTRAEKLSVTRAILGQLTARRDHGPPEPALDAFIPELTTVADALATHTTAQDHADQAHAAYLARVETADIDVDTWTRHIVNFILVEAGRRAGPNVLAARALAAAACPDGLAHVDDRIVEENRHCRDMLHAMRTPEHAETVRALELPASWLLRLEDSLDQSDAAIAAATETRGDASQHVTLRHDAETAWLDAIVRLRNYIASRAHKGDTARQTENRKLLAPLLDAVARHRSEAHARATRRDHHTAATPGTPGTAGGAGSAGTGAAGG